MQVSQESPTKFRAISVLVWILSIPDTLSQESFLTTLANCVKSMGASSSKSSGSSFYGRHSDRIKEIFKELLPPLCDIPSSGHQFSTQPRYHVGQALFSFFESLYGLPELTWGQLKVLLHGLLKLLHPNSSFWSYLSCVPVSCLRWLTVTTKPERPPTSVWWFLSLPMSTCRSSGCYHDRNLQLSGHNPASAVSSSTCENSPGDWCWRSDTGCFQFPLSSHLS